MINSPDTRLITNNITYRVSGTAMAYKADITLTETQIEIMGDKPVTITLDSLTNVARPKLKQIHTITLRTAEGTYYEIYFHRQAAAQAEWLAMFKAKGLSIGDDYFPGAVKASVTGILLLGVVIAAAFVIYGLVTDKPGSSNTSRLFIAGLFALLLIVTALVPAGSRKK